MPDREHDHHSPPGTFVPRVQLDGPFSVPVPTDPFPNELVEAAEAAIIAVVEDKLQWNVNAYGKAWTGEGEDTDFICGGTGQAVLAAVLPLIEQRVKDECSRGKRARASMTDPTPNERRLVVTAHWTTAPEGLDSACDAMRPLKEDGTKGYAAWFREDDGVELLAALREGADPGAYREQEATDAR